MSQKAWMNAYTKGSKAMQARLQNVHKNNPEFQEFIKKHGMGGNLSVKQSGIQKKSSVATVKPTTDAHPERSNLDRLALIKAAAEKQRDRRRAHSNRVAFGGELGGSFSMPMGGFRRYSEEFALDEATLADKIRAHPAVEYYGGKDDDHMVNLKKGWHMGDGQRSFGNQNVRDTWHDLKRVVKFKPGEAKEYGLEEDIAYKDGTITMHRGGWIAKRNGKQIGTTAQTDKGAKDMIDSTQKTLSQKTIEVLKKKKMEIAKGLGRFSMATESAANRRRVRSWDSAVMPELKPLRVKKKDNPPFTPDKPKKNLGIVVGKNDPGYSKARHLARLGLKQELERERINKTIDYIKNPKNAVLDKHVINRTLKGIK